MSIVLHVIDRNYVIVSLAPRPSSSSMHIAHKTTPMKEREGLGMRLRTTMLISELTLAAFAIKREHGEKKRLQDQALFITKVPRAT